MSKGAIWGVVGVLFIIGCIGSGIEKCSGKSEKTNESSASSYSTSRGDSNSKSTASSNEKKKYVGKWSMFTCQYNHNKFDTGKLNSFPYKIVLNENGTGIMYWEGANNNSFNWSLDNGQISFSGTNLNIAINSQGYILCRCPVIKSNMGIIVADFFFQK